MVKTKLAVPKVKLPTEKEKKELPSGVGQEAMRVATDSAEIFQLMETRDEQQIMQAIMGVYSQEYIYDIPFKGGPVFTCKTPGCQLATRKTPHTHVRGLSWSGIKEARRIFKGIDTQKLSEPVVVEHDGKQYYQASASAVDLRTGNSTTVFKRQPLLKKKKSGEYIEDPFAFEIVQSKAKRNAIAEILPQPLVRGWIQDWLGGKKDFDPKRVVDLQKGEDYTVEDEEAKGGEKLTGAKLASGPQLTKIYADFRAIEKLGGTSFDTSLTAWKKQYNVDSFKALTLVQASKIIKKSIEEIAILAKVAAEKESQEHHDEPPGSNENKANKIQAIKAALKGLGWNLEDPLSFSSLLSPYDLSTLEDLEKVDEATLDAILNDVGARSKEL